MSLNIQSNFSALDKPRQGEPTGQWVMAAVHTQPAVRRAPGANEDVADAPPVQRLNTAPASADTLLRSANDNIGAAEAAIGGLAKLAADLQAMRELAIQAREEAEANREALDRRFDELATSARNTLERMPAAIADGGSDGAFTPTPEASAAPPSEDPPPAPADANSATDDPAGADVPSNAVVQQLVGARADGSGRARIGAGADVTQVIDGIEKATALVDGKRTALEQGQKRIEAELIRQQRGSAHDGAASPRRALDEASAAQTSAHSRARMLEQPRAAMAAQAHLVARNVLSLLDSPSAA